MADRTMRRMVALTMACAAMLAVTTGGCTAPSPARMPSPPVSAVAPATRLDTALAEKTVLAYITAMRSGDATAAATLMTSNRSAETSAPGWAADVSSWRTARVKTVAHPGRYIADERSFAELYASRTGHPPYKLVVLNVSYSRGAKTATGSTDFVVTQDSANAPWLVDDYGGAPSTGN